MQTKFIEAHDGAKFNWGKFMLGRWDATECGYRSAIDSNPLIRGRGWGAEHLLVLDLQTGEGAMFAIKAHGLPSSDLNKHEVWVCPMFEPFLGWLYKQDVTDLDKLPSLVDLGKVETAMYGYRRAGNRS